MTETARAQRDSAAFRTRRFRLAVFTGLAGKGATFLVQIVALPLAVAALGPEKFGAYAMLAAILSWMNVASVTITPGVTIQLVDANAGNDREAQQRVVTSALFFAGVLALFLFFAIHFANLSFGPGVLFGADVAKFHQELSNGLMVLGALLATNLVTAVAEAAQAGYQNQYLHNLFLSAGSLVTVVALTLLVSTEPTISNMILAVYAPPLLARALSMVQLLWVRPYLIPRFRHLDLPTLRTMLRTGAAFSVTTFAAFGYQSFSVYWVGRQAGPADGGLMALCVMILNVSGGLLLLFTQPLWPAIRDAVARNDLAWARDAYRRTIGYIMLYVALASLTIAIGGGYLARHWIKVGGEVTPLAQCLLGFYFLLVAWEHTNYSFLIGLGRQWYAAISYSAGALLMLALAMVLVDDLAVSGMLLAMCAGPLFTTVWLYPRKIAELFGKRHKVNTASQP